MRRSLISFVSVLAATCLVIPASGCGQSTHDPLPVAGEDERPAPERINLVAIQMEAEPDRFADEDSYREYIFDLMDMAADKTTLGPDSLVVFPEHVGTFTVLLGDGEIIGESHDLAEAMEGIIRKNLVGLSFQRLRHQISWPRALFVSRQDRMAQLYFSVFSDLARKHRSYVVAGTAALSDRTLALYLPPEAPGHPGENPCARSVYNVSVVFGPEGEVLGAQRKVGLVELEGPGGLDLVAEDPERIRAVPTSLGRLGIAICLDAFKDLVLDRLQEEQAEILVQPSANPVPWAVWQQEEWLLSSWRAVYGEQRFAYGVNPMMTGSLLDLEFFGQSALISALDDLVDEPAGYRFEGSRPGFLVVAGSDTGTEVVHFRVPLDPPD